MYITGVIRRAPLLTEAYNPNPFFWVDTGLLDVQGCSCCQLNNFVVLLLFDRIFLMSAKWSVVNTISMVVDSVPVLIPVFKPMHICKAYGIPITEIECV